MKRIGLLTLTLLMLWSMAFASGKGMKLTICMKNAPIIGKIEIRTGYIKEEIILGDDKSGCIYIQLDHGQYANLQVGYGKDLLYLEPGKDLTLILVPDKDGGYPFQRNCFDYQGEKENVKINKYLSAHKLEMMQPIDFVLDENQFLNKLSKLDKANRKMIKKQKFPKEFETNEMMRAKYILYNPLVRYPVQHFWKEGSKWTGLEQYEETPIVKAYIPQLFIDSEEAWKSAPYRDYLRGGIAILAESEFMSNDKQKAALEQLEYLEQHFKTPVILEDITHTLTLRYIESTEGRPLGEIQSYYDRNVKNETYRQEIARAQKVWARFSKGTDVMSSGYKYQHINGDMVSLDDLKGKYVYIDVWATWCGPCKAEIPHLKALEKKFEGKNIYFVSISVDANKAAWIKMVQEDQLGGVQLHGGSKAQIMKDYMIKGIPRFILLDMDGKVIEKDMTRPSDPSTEKTLNALQGI